MKDSIHHKKLSTQSRDREQFVAENQEIIQGIREIKSDVKEIKKFMVMNNLRRLVDNYDNIIQVKRKKLAKDWELAERDKQRNKKIAEWDRIQAEDEKSLDN